MLDQLLKVRFISMALTMSPGWPRRSLSSRMEPWWCNKLTSRIRSHRESSSLVATLGPRRRRESSPLTRTGTQFRFLHRSMLEYSLSCAVLDPSGHDVDDEFCPQPGLDLYFAQLLATDGPLLKRYLLIEPSVTQFLCELKNKMSLAEIFLLTPFHLSLIASFLVTLSAFSSISSAITTKKVCLTPTFLFTPLPPHRPFTMDLISLISQQNASTSSIHNMT
ncbi:hypothetical protein K457DRAFT_723034 [Linnemannia elongata AG-77]|uniref:Uncharacterized protein n=1 Tax=Linnemannia elongata AG-77 TaxID=1314771 RepID=A0A197JLZ9_9FUNG|nr:hypothetical protein K457DRAFT_723034 [Linnemannia elongata AG-77]